MSAWTQRAVGQELALAAEASVAGKGDPREVEARAQHAQAMGFLQALRFEEAIPLLESLLAENPENPDLLWNYGIATAGIGEHGRARDAWLKYRQAAPRDWRARAKLVQAYQALGENRLRDQERDQLLALWKRGTDLALTQQHAFCREHFSHNGNKVLVFEHLRNVGERIVFYTFVVLDEAAKEAFRISMGSYEATNRAMWELGRIPRSRRLYHLDLYRPDRHETYGLYEERPGYEKVRAEAVAVLEGGRVPVSIARTDRKNG